MCNSRFCVCFTIFTLTLAWEHLLWIISLYMHLSVLIFPWCLLVPRNCFRLGDWLLSRLPFWTCGHHHFSSQRVCRWGEGKDRKKEALLWFGVEPPRPLCWMVVMRDVWTLFQVTQRPPSVNEDKPFGYVIARGLTIPTWVDFKLFCVPYGVGTLLSRCVVAGASPSRSQGVISWIFRPYGVGFWF